MEFSSLGTFDGCLMASITVVWISGTMVNTLIQEMGDITVYSCPKSKAAARVEAHAITSNVTSLHV